MKPFLPRINPHLYAVSGYPGTAPHQLKSLYTFLGIAERFFYSFFIDPAGITERKIPDDLGERNIGDLNHPGNMFRHQAAALNLMMKPFDAFCIQLFEDEVVLYIEKDGLSAISMQHYVQSCTGEVYSGLMSDE